MSTQSIVPRLQSLVGLDVIRKFLNFNGDASLFSGTGILQVLQNLGVRGGRSANGHNICVTGAASAASSQRNSQSASAQNCGGTSQKFVHDVPFPRVHVNNERIVKIRENKKKPAEQTMKPGAVPNRETP